MSRFNPHFPNAGRVLEAAAEWGERCLLRDGSLFTDEQLWTPENIDAVKTAFVDNLIDTPGGFLEKFRTQLSDAPTSAVHLAAEMFWILTLFPSNMGESSKRDQTREIWSWSGLELDAEHHLLRDEALGGLGSGGPAFLMHRWRELRFLIVAVSAFKRKDEAERQQLLADPWKFTEWLESVPDDGYRQLRHILPHLLFPDEFERIAGHRDVSSILVAVGGMPKAKISSMSKIEMDRAILDLRRKLENEYQGEPIDFYQPKFTEIWKPSNVGADEAEFTPPIAEALLEGRFERLRPATQYIASFVTPEGQHLALERERKTVCLWLEPPLPDVEGVNVHRAYETHESRNSNLPGRLAAGNRAIYAEIADAEALEALIGSLSGRFRMTLNRVELDQMVDHFRAHMSDFTTFAAQGGVYHERERSYKDAFIRVFGERAGPLLEKPISTAEEAYELLSAVSSAFTERLDSSGPQNMVSWRAFEHLKQLKGDVAIEAAQALQSLWTNDGSPAQRFEEFAAVYVPLLEALGHAGAKGAVRAFGSIMLAVQAPREAVFIRTNLWDTISKRLIGRRIFKNQPVTAEEYEEALALAEALYRDFVARGWEPVDYWDVHNFLWVATEYDPIEDSEEDAPSSSISLIPKVDPEDINAIAEAVASRGLLFERETIERYHLGLRTRNFVILAGDSGIGKTQLAITYAEVTGAALEVAPVAPNWTSNEDLLGFFNPIDGGYRHTLTSRFLIEAAVEHEAAKSEGRAARPFHLVLDEMNLARVEHYFARLLSAMERRSSAGEFMLELEPGKPIILGPNLFVVGTVNVDETSHGFADKVYDRAQLIEIEVSERLITGQLDGVPYADLVVELWQRARSVAPFAFRTITDINTYCRLGAQAGLTWEACLDHQIRQKILPKAKGADPRVAGFLEFCIERLEPDRFPLSHTKAQSMLDQHQTHGYASYF